MASQDSWTEVGACSPIPTDCAPRSPSSVDTCPGSIERQLSQSFSASMRRRYQLSTVLVGAYAALGIGRWFLHVLSTAALVCRVGQQLQQTRGRPHDHENGFPSGPLQQSKCSLVHRYDTVHVRLHVRLNILDLDVGDGWI